MSATTPRARARGPAVPASAALLALLSVACSPVHVTRDVRAVWASDSSSVLVVRSEYDSFNPSNPYYYDPTAANFELVLLRAAAPAPGATSLGPLVELDRFEEGLWDAALGKEIPLSAGGLAQYSPVYWFPALDRAVFSGGNLGAFARDLGRGTTTWYLKPALMVRAAFAAAYPDQDPGRLDFLAANVEPREALPSPDGSLIVALYVLAEAPNGFLLDFDYWSVLVLFDAATGEALSAVVPLADIRSEPWSQFDPYAPLATEARNYGALSWAPDSSGLYVFYFQHREVPVGGESRRPRLVPLGAGGRAFGPAAEATDLPRRPLPSPSGPVSAGGLAISLDLQGNGTKLTVGPFTTGSAPAFVPFAEEATVPVATFLAASRSLGY